MCGCIQQLEQQQQQLKLLQQQLLEQQSAMEQQQQLLQQQILTHASVQLSHNATVSTSKHLVHPLSDAKWLSF